MSFKGTDAAERRRLQNRDAQRKRRNNVRCQLQQLSARNSELLQFQETVLRAARRSSATLDSQHIEQGETTFNAAVFSSPELGNDDLVQELFPRSAARSTSDCVGAAKPSPDNTAEQQVIDDRFWEEMMHVTTPARSGALVNTIPNSQAPEPPMASRCVVVGSTTGTEPEATATRDYSSLSIQPPSAELTASEARDGFGDGRHGALCIAVAKGNVSMINLLIKYGAEINRADELGRTPLHHAIECCHWEVIELLLDNGADVDAVDNHGMTALQLAASSDNLPAAEVLLQHTMTSIALSSTSQSSSRSSPPKAIPNSGYTG